MPDLRNLDAQGRGALGHPLDFLSPAIGERSSGIFGFRLGLAVLDQIHLQGSPSGPYAAFSSDVQCGHRVALIGMLDRQYRHSLVVGTAGTSD